MQRHEVRIKI
ncbi:TPA: hypothetical protein ENS27_10795 [bacterium]|nr:hypothetical protein [bacterium]